MDNPHDTFRFIFHNLIEGAEYTKNMAKHLLEKFEINSFCNREEKREQYEKYTDEEFAFMENPLIAFDDLFDH